MTAIAPAAVTTPTPIPAGRGRWRVTLHNRAWTATSWQNTIIAQLDGARSRRLTRQWNTPAEFAFTLDGRDPAARLVQELATEVVVWRWNGWPDAQPEPIMFRGIIDHAEDQVTEQAAVTNYVAHDMAGMLSRRLLTQPYTVTGRDQDLLVGDLVNFARTTQSSSGTSFSPGAWLPLSVDQRQPNGAAFRGFSGQLRDRGYTAGSNIWTLLDDLSKVINGFDWDVQPFNTVAAGGTNTDGLWVYYPQQGVTRTDMAFLYGSTVSGFTRTVASSDYANYWRTTGNSPTTTDPPMFSEAWNTDANNVTVNPVGLWMGQDNAADVSIQTTLDQMAQGQVLAADGVTPGGLAGLLVPSYSLTLRPGVYRTGFPNMGDVVPFIANVGRLNINTSVRVLGLQWNISDDADEQVTVTVGRPPQTLAGLLAASKTDIDALTRR